MKKVKIYDVLLDIEKQLYSPLFLLFSVSPNEFNMIQLDFVITQDGMPLDLTNKTVELAVKKPSGLAVYQACEITNALEGKAKVLLALQAYIEYGIYTAEVYIRDADQLAVTSPFWYQSRSTVMENEEDTTNELTDFQKALFGFDLKPVITEGAPTLTPEYIGQMAFDNLNKVAYIATDLTNGSWRTFGTGEGGGAVNDTIFGDNPLNFTPARIGQIFIDEINRNAYIALGTTAEDWEQIDNEEVIKQAITWAEILNKPVAFPPEIHTHDYMDIQGKPLLFPPENHNHSIAEITGLQDALNSKADDSDLTTKANIDDVYTKLETYNKDEVDTIVTGITEGGGTVVEDNLISTSTNNALSANQGRVLDETKADTIHTHVWADITDAPETFSPETHGHLISEVENLQTELDGKADLVHTHVKADITDFAHSHDWAEVTGKPLAFVPEVHTHAWIDITDKPLTFAPEAHNHTKADITDFAHTHLWADITDKPTTFTPEIHTHDFDSITNKPVAYPSIAHYHAIADVVGLETALDGKADIIPANEIILEVTNLTNSVQLDWSVGTATSWTIWRSEVKNTLGEKLIGGLITNTYTDTTALGGTTYYYTLQVENVSQKTISDQVEATPYTILVDGAKRVDFMGYAGWTVYTTTEATADFGNVDTLQGGDRLKIDTSERLRFYLPMGMVGSSDTGGIIKAKIAGKTDYTIEYGIRFDTGFPWSKGGKVPGFSGGAGYTGGNPAWDGDGFSVRLMWREGGRIIPYLYHYNQPDEFGDTFGETLGYFTDTQEHIVKYYAVLNTGANPDGVLKIYLDGIQVFEKRDLVYRTDESLIDTAHISIFAGGSGADWNMTGDGYIRLNYFDWR